MAGQCVIVLLMSSGRGPSGCGAERCVWKSSIEGLVSERIGWVMVGIDMVAGGGGQESRTYEEEDRYEDGQRSRRFFVGRGCDELASESESAVGSSR